MMNSRTFLLILVLPACAASAEQSVGSFSSQDHPDKNVAGIAFEQVTPGATGLIERLEYDVRWRFLSVGSATIETVRLQDGGTNRTARIIKVHNHPWARILYCVEDRIECVEEETARHRTTRVTKRIHEGSFRQDDVLLIDFDTGTAQWKDLLTGNSAGYPVPKGVQDYVSMLFDLRAQGALTLGQTNSYHLAMDGGVHEFVVSTVATGLVRTADGDIVATRLLVQSKSAGLFARNVPGVVWVSLEPVVILAMDAATKLGTVQAVLKKWERNGKEQLHNAVAKGD